MAQKHILNVWDDLEGKYVGIPAIRGKQGPPGPATNSKPFVVTVTYGDDDTLTADKTHAEIVAAYAAGEQINAKIVNYPGVIVPSILPLYVNNADLVFIFSGSGVLDGSAMAMTAIDTNGSWRVELAELATLWDIPSGGTDTSLGVTGATVGQTVKIKAVDGNGKPTEWEAADKMEASKANWNQNDDTKSDYVQNRTHYEESTYTDYVLNMSGIEIAGFSLPEVGDTVTVKINGVDSAETVKVAEFNSMTYKYIGNIDLGSLLNGGSGWCTLDLQGHVGGYAKPDTTITVETIVVHKINEKFINFDGFVRTFDYHFKDPTIYKTLYNDNGDICLLYRCNSFILPKSDQLFGFMSETGFSRVGDLGVNSCFVTGFIISDLSSITIQKVVLGTNTTEMEQIAANNGYTLTTNPNA